MSTNTSSTLSSLTNVFSNSLNSTNTLTTGISSTVKDNFDAIFNSKYIYVGLIVVIIVCVLLAWTLYYIISARVFALTKTVSEDTLNPLLGNTKRKFNFSFEKSANGERRSYTFWLYLHDMNVGKGMYKNVFSISDTKEDPNISTSSPYVFLDKDQNRLYVRFSKLETASVAETYRYTDISGTDTTQLANFMKSGIVIPYVPLQRWVHIAIVCNANSYKNYIYAYVDGDLVNTTSTGETDRIPILKTAQKDLRNLNLNRQGFLNVGGTPNDQVDGPGFSGLISKITTYNYELNQQDIYDDYYKGPIGGFLAAVGLSNYGLRSPIYKIS